MKYKLIEATFAYTATVFESDDIDEVFDVMTELWQELWTPDCDEEESYLEYGDHDGHAQIVDDRGLFAVWDIES